MSSWIILTCWRLVEEKIKEAEERITVEVKALEDADLLTTIPGNGSLHRLAHVLRDRGWYIRRFSCAEKLCSYAVLVPMVKQSGSWIKHGGITKQGSRLLRWALVEAVWVHLRCRCDTPLTRYFQWVVKRKSGGSCARKRAAVATVRKMLHVIYAMLRDGKPFDYDYLGKGRVDCVSVLCP
jgi:transposase